MLKKCLLITCIALCNTGTAFCVAPVFDESETEQFAIIADNDNQEKPFVQEEQNNNNSNNPALNNNEVLNKLNGLQQEIQELRGQLEIQANNLKQLQDQQLNFYKDIDSRLQQQTPLKKPNPITPSTTSVEIPQKTVSYNKNNPVDEQISYLAAYDFVKTNQYDEAIQAMKKFVNKYPDSGYTKNAQYWIVKLSKEQQKSV